MQAKIFVPHNSVIFLPRGFFMHDMLMRYLPFGFGDAPLLPGACVLCRAPGRRGLCALCLGDIGKLRRPARCRQCAAAVPSDGLLCGACLKTPPHFDGTQSLYPYAFPLDILLRRFKFGGGWQLAGALAGFLPPLPDADIVLPVPLHPNRERWRGFNQSHELLRAITKSAKVEDATAKAQAIKSTPAAACIKRITDTPHQSLMTGAKARQKNVRGAFTASGVSGKRIVIVDDVMTSGATLNEIAKTLKKAGAKTITNLVIART